MIYSNGRPGSLKYIIDSTQRHRIKPILYNKYYGVYIKRKVRLIHQFMCETYHGPRPTPFHEVRHLDEDRTNNTLTNLVWGTNAENIIDRSKHGRLTGSNQSNAKLHETDIPGIRARLAAGENPTHIAKSYPVTARAITAISRGETWTHVP